MWSTVSLMEKSFAKRQPLDKKLLFPLAYMQKYSIYAQYIINNSLTKQE